MLNHRTVKSTELEHETGLRQPEVSVSMRELKERGWIKTTIGKTSGKGRPYNVYTLSISMDDIIQTYEINAEANLRDTNRRIQKLKEMK